MSFVQNVNRQVVNEGITERLTWGVKVPLYVKGMKVRYTEFRGQLSLSTSLSLLLMKFLPVNPANFRQSDLRS